MLHSSEMKPTEAIWFKEIACFVCGDACLNKKKIFVVMSFCLTLINQILEFTFFVTMIHITISPLKKLVKGAPLAAPPSLWFPHPCMISKICFLLVLVCHCFEGFYESELQF